jgi:hypothetical protein
MYRQQNSGQIYKTKIGNKSLKNVENFKYVGKTLIDQNGVPEEIKSRLNSGGNACYHSVWNFCLPISI